jgi:glycerophosphoryl diester phosphodiesterase
MKNKSCVLQALVIAVIAFIVSLQACSCEVLKSCRKPQEILQQDMRSDASIQEWKKLKEKINKTDQTFGAYWPLLFAHRGGVLEAPESTLRAFRYARDVVGVDVLELDVQITKDGQFVVWHGPELCNVYIEGEETDPNKRDRQNIYEYFWEKDLKDKAWVADPWECCVTHVLEEEIGKRKDRRLMLLSEFLDAFPGIPLNIEMKESFKYKLGGRNSIEDNVKAFRKILDEGKNDRPIVVASLYKSVLKVFRKTLREVDGPNYITVLSPFEYISFSMGLFSDPQDSHVLEVNYDVWESTIARAREKQWETYVFLTGFSFLSKPLDRERDEPFAMEQDKELYYSISKLLNRGVDGIMTDRPKLVRDL